MTAPALQPQRPSHARWAGSERANVITAPAFQQLTESTGALFPEVLSQVVQFRLFHASLEHTCDKVD